MPKLLFDENLSPRLARALVGDYPGSAHLRDVDLEGAKDTIAWDFALLHGYVLVTKDEAFIA